MSESRTDVTVCVTPVGQGIVIAPRPMTGQQNAEAAPRTGMHPLAKYDSGNLPSVDDFNDPAAGKDLTLVCDDIAFTDANNKVSQRRVLKFDRLHEIVLVREEGVDRVHFFGLLGGVKNRVSVRVEQAGKNPRTRLITPPEPYIEVSYGSENRFHIARDGKPAVHQHYLAVFSAFGELIR